MTTAPARLDLDRTAVAGLAAGGLAAVAGSLVSLLVRSPDPDVANTGSVSVVALLAGVAAGLMWWAFGDGVVTARSRAAWGTAAGALALVLLAVFDAATLDGLLGYGIVPAVVIAGVIAGFLPWFGRAATPTWVRNVAVLAAIVAGAFLSGLS